MAYDLLFGWWPGFEIGGVIGEVPSIRASADNECNVYIAELRKFMGFFIIVNFLLLSLSLLRFGVWTGMFGAEDN